MYKYILFDLDGTLLHFNHEEFAKTYFTLLGSKVAHLVNPKVFIQQLLATTDYMVKNLDETKTNEQVFWEHFNQQLPLPQNEFLPVITEFYNTDFSYISKVTNSTVHAKNALEMLVQQGKTLVLATNPIFPKVAVQHRLKWAGISHIPFKHITSYENSHFCKPNIEYYQEILAILNCQPSECLMIGNDVEEDLAAGKLGITTYLLTDNMLNLKDLPIQADYISTIAELDDKINELLI